MFGQRTQEAQHRLKIHMEQDTRSWHAPDFSFMLSAHDPAQCEWRGPSDRTLESQTPMSH
jgi:hypothetical protein